MATVTRRLNEGVLTISIDKPPLNTLSSEVIEGIDGAVAEAQVDDRVRVIVLTGAGERAFSAGADVREFAELFAGGVRDILRSRHQFLERLESSRCPIIAALNGFTLGGGFETALACHFRLASDDVQLGLPEVKLGIIPGWAGTQRLTKVKI